MNWYQQKENQLALGKLKRILSCFPTIQITRVISYQFNNINSVDVLLSFFLILATILSQVVIAGGGLFVLSMVLLTAA